MLINNFLICLLILNEIYNDIKFRLKIDQWVMRSAFSDQKKKPRPTNLHKTGKFQNKLSKVSCWTVRIEFFDISKIAFK